MLKKTFQSVINQIDMFLVSPVGVIDTEGITLATNSSGSMAEYASDFIETCAVSMTQYQCRGYSICGIGKVNRVEYVVYVKGIDTDAQRTCMMLAVSMANIQQFYNDKYDKTTYMKNIISDNTLPLDMHQRSKELHLEYDQHRAVFVIRVVQSGDVSTLDIIMGLYPESDKDFVFSMDENTVVLIKEVAAASKEADLENIAQNIMENLNAEALAGALVGISTVADNISQLAAAYKEAQVALEIGRVFEKDKYIISYKSLGVGRLIYHLPTRLCQLFLQEVLTKRGLDALDEEIIDTIYEFFKNDLNVSETARQLYIHRNTLVYRLDKVQKTIGLDLRKFDDAVVFKVAMMVEQYLTANPMKI